MTDKQYADIRFALWFIIAELAVIAGRLVLT